MKSPIQRGDKEKTQVWSKEACREVTGHEIPAEVAPRRAGDPAVLIASSEKIQAELGWNPTRTELGRIVRDAWAFTQELGDASHSAR